MSIASFVSGDILTANTTGLPSITPSYNAATGVLTLTGSDTLADYQAVLRSVTFSVSPGNTDPTAGGGTTSSVIDWVINDGATVSPTGTSTLDLVHVAPTLTAGGTVTFTGGGAAVRLDPTLTVNDVDSGGVLTGATISIGTGHAAVDALTFTNANGITGSYNATTGVLTLTGTATIANYQTALESITYSVSPATPTRPTAAATPAARSTGPSATATAATASATRAAAR